MKYRRRSDGSVFDLKGLRQQHKNISFPLQGPNVDTLNELGYDPIAAGTKPSTGPWERLIGPQVTDVNGVWTYTWTVAEYPLEEAKQIAIQQVNNERQARFYSDYAYGGDFIQFRDEVDRANLTNLQQFAVLGNDIPLRLANNTTVNVPSATFIADITTLFASKMAINQKASQLKDTINGVSSVGEIPDITADETWNG